MAARAERAIAELLLPCGTELKFEEFGFSAADEPLLSTKDWYAADACWRTSLTSLEESLPSVDGVFCMALNFIRLFADLPPLVTDRC